MAANTPPDGGADVRDASVPQAYDLTRPGKLSPAEIKRLGYLHDDLAKRLEMSLAGLFRDYVEVTPDALTEARWSGLVASLPSPCAVFMFEAPPLRGMGLLRMDPDLAFALVDRLFGGRGEAVDLGRELTPIEQRAVGRFAGAVLAEVEAVWHPFIDLKVAPTGFASSPDLVESGGVDESVIDVGLKIEAGPLSGTVHVTYPHHMFEPAIGALSPKLTSRGEPAGSQGPAEMVNTLSLPVSARLAPTMVGMKHLVDLNVGDVLLLDNRVSDDVEVLVGGKPVMKARPGSHSGRLAVKITRFSVEGG